MFSSGSVFKGFWFAARVAGAFPVQHSMAKKKARKSLILKSMNCVIDEVGEALELVWGIAEEKSFKTPENITAVMNWLVDC